MSDEPPPLDESLRALVQSERSTGSIAAPGRASVKARLDAMLMAPRGGGDGGGGAGSGGASAGPRAAARMTRLAAAFAAGAVAGAAIMYAVRPVRVVETVVTVERAAPSPSSSSSPVSAPRVQREATPPEPEDAAVPLAPVRSRPPGDSLAAERALLDPARTALGRGDGASALEAVRKHEAAFRSGALTEEREAIAVQALAQLGRREEARSRGERFLARYPGSVLAPAVFAALEAAR